MNNTQEQVSLFTIFKLFFIIGATSFGGGVVAYLRDAIVEKNQWMDDEEFLATLEISQTMPGLNTVNISILTGDKLYGIYGAIVAAIGMILPGCVMVAILGMLYSQNAHSAIVIAILAGAACAAVGLLIAVTLKIGKKQFSNVTDFLLITLTFICAAILKLHLFYIILIIAPIGIWLYRPKHN